MVKSQNIEGKKALLVGMSAFFSMTLEKFDCFVDVDLSTSEYFDLRFGATVEGTKVEYT